MKNKKVVQTEYRIRRIVYSKYVVEGTGFVILFSGVMACFGIILSGLEGKLNDYQELGNTLFMIGMILLISICVLGLVFYLIYNSDNVSDGGKNEKDR